MARQDRGRGTTSALPSSLLSLDRGTKARLAAAAVLVGLTLASMAAFACWGGAFFPTYRDASRTVLSALALLTSAAPFSLWPVVLAAIVAAILAQLVLCFLRRLSLLRCLSNALLVAAVLAALFVGVWGLNHYAPPLTEDLDLDVGEYSRQELLDATRWYLDEAALRAGDVPRTSQGSLERQDFRQLAVIAGSSYEPLAAERSVFDGSTVPVKRLLFGDLLLMSGHNGIFVAVTGESCVPENAAVADVPFTMCHEVAHRFGIASEREANFCAILVCTASDDARFAYSGYFKAFCYCYSALASNYPDAIGEVLGRDRLPASMEAYRLVVNDAVETSEHYRQYEGALEEVGTAANDLYLKSFSQEDGVKSYGQVVDYLIAWHAQKAAS